MFLKSNVSRKRYRILELKFLNDPLSSFKIVTRNSNDWPVIILILLKMLKYGILASDRCYSNYCQTDKLLNYMKKHVQKYLKNCLSFKK